MCYSSKQDLILRTYIFVGLQLQKGAQKDFQKHLRRLKEDLISIEVREM